MLRHRGAKWGVFAALLSAALFVVGCAPREQPGDEPTDDSTVDIVTAVPPTIRGTVFDDLDEDGEHDRGEPGLAGVSVVANGTDTGFSASTTTDEQGAFQLAVPGGNYQLSVDISALANEGIGYEMTTGERWLSTALTVLPGFDRNELMIGYHTDERLGSIRGVLFEDRNSNSTQEANEPGIAGVAVAIAPEDGEPVEVVTGADGSFTAQMPPGDVWISVEAESLPSQADRAFELSTDEAAFGPHTIVEGEAVSGLAIGYAVIQTTAVTGRVFQDDNDNGTFDAGETGLSGVTVTAVPVGQASATPPQAVTEQDGIYELVLPGAGVVIVTPDTATLPPAPEGLVYRRTAGSAASGQRVEITLGQTSSGVDFGYTPVVAATLTGLVFEDLNSNSLRDGGEIGIANVTVAAIDEVGRRTVAVTDADGRFSVSYVPPRAVLEVDESTLPPHPGGYTLTAGEVLLRNTFNLAPGGTQAGLNIGFRPNEAGAGDANTSNPFADPDAELTSRFGVPATLPVGAGTATAPLAGQWRFSPGAGTLSCGAAAVRQLTPGAQQSITLARGVGRITLYGLPDADGAAVWLGAETGVNGRYRGSVTLSETEGLVTLDYAVQLVTEEQMIGYLTGDTFVDGTRCTLYRTFQAEHTGA